MTTHIIFKSLDKKNCITHSRKGIKYIRNKIGFKNLIISDDISMKALKYSFKENVEKAYASGCNLVLHLMQYERNEKFGSYISKCK